MIVKTKQRLNSTTATASARDLFKYIHQAEKGVTSLHTGSLNLLTEGYEAQREEFALIASMAKKSKTPVTHYILSWKEHERPTSEQGDEAARIFCRELGLEEYAVAYALHDDTRNRHLHIACNRAHPETGKVLDIKFSAEKAHRAIARIERVQNWQKEANGIFDFDENGRLFRTDRDVNGKYIRREEERNRPKKSRGARDFERRTGQRSAEQIAADDLAPLIKAATSWKEVHLALRRENAYYVRRGSGAVLIVNGTPVKASAADRDAAFNRLEKRFGPYEAGPEPKDRDGILLDRKAAPAVRAYAEQRYEKLEAREIGREREQVRYVSALQDVASETERNRKTVETQAKRELDPMVAHHLLRVLALVEREEREALKMRRAKERTGRGRADPLPDYAAYLRAQGFGEAADVFRYRNTQNYLTGAYRTPEPIQMRDYTPVAVGREMYYLHGEKTVFIDKGSRIMVTAANDEAAVLATLRVAHQKWGEIHLQGAQEFRERAAMIGLAAHLNVVEVGQGIDLEALRRKLEEARAQDPNFIAMNEPEREVTRHKRMVVHPAGKSTKRSGGFGFGD